MNGIAVSDLKDLVTVTLSEYNKGGFQDIAGDLQEYLFLNKLLPRYKSSKRGKSYQFPVMTAYGENAENTAPYAVDNTVVNEHMAMGEVPWRFTKTAYAFDLREEAINSGDPEQIVDLIAARKQAAMGALAVLMEENGWGTPSDSSDELTPYGIPYWVVKNSSEGFNGGAPSGFTEVGGLNPTTYSNWKNYTGTYANITKDDAIRTMRKAALLTSFKTPLKSPAYDTSGISDRYQIYVNEDTYLTMAEIGEAQNDNLGKDIASMDGIVVFHKNPIIFVPYLDNDTDDPIYMINWGVMSIATLNNWVLRENVREDATRNNVVKVDTDLVWNVVCENRRLQTVLYKA